jgi:hypothetical protein
MKYILILYMCSMTTGQCPSNSIAGLQFNDHFDCVVNGYRVAHNTFKNLEETEDFDKEKINREKLVIKFECKQVGEDT